MKTNLHFANSYNAVVFDCDGTLSKLEGIDELARMNNVGPKIEQMTREAMTDGNLTTEIYEERLNIVQPTKVQLDILGEMYAEQVTPFASTVIQDLQALGKVVYIISAGILQPVRDLGNFLGISHENIFAVDVSFDEEGRYKDFDRESPLTDAKGKAKILKKLKNEHDTIVLVGDGMNDLLSANAVDCFIGFGGHFFRENIADKSAYYITDCTLLPVLALCATEDETLNISPVDSDYRLAKKHLDLIE